MSHQQSRLNRFQGGSKWADRLKVEPRPNQAALLRLVLLNLSIVETGVKAVDRQHFLVGELRQRGSPIQHWIVMQPKVVSEPQDNSVHRLLVKLKISAFRRFVGHRNRFSFGFFLGLGQNFDFFCWFGRGGRRQTAVAARNFFERLLQLRSIALFGNLL